MPLGVASGRHGLTWPDMSAPPERGWSWDSGLCMVLDCVVSFIGWMLFGNSWPGVRTGCQRIFRLLALLVLCMGAHYLWAIVLASVSLCFALVVMGLIWMLRAIVRKLGTLVYWAQQAAGGVPEAYDAEFLGPGTGRIPETADLRPFKKTVGSADKWVLVRREGHVAVFKAGSRVANHQDTGALRSSRARHHEGRPGNRGCMPRL